MHLTLIDDNEIDIFVNQKLIESADNTIRVSSYLNPKEALQSLDNASTDLIVIDNQMPELSGYDFLTKLHAKHNELPKTIVLTASVREELEKQYKSIDHNIELWEKPLSVDRLTGLLSKVD